MSSVAEPALPPRTAPFVAERLHDHPVSSIAVGKALNMATYGSEPYLFDARGWRLRALPASKGDVTVAWATIYYGRDNQPRLMGAFARGDVREPLYFRHFASGFRAEPTEIATLANTPGGLYGVLGYEDPEVVCAPGAYCLVKSVQGWKRMPAAAEPERLFMTSQGVRVARGDQLFALEQTTWVPVAELPAVNAADVTAVCHQGAERTWLTAGGAVYLRDLAQGPSFVAQPNVSKRAHAVACEHAESVWVVGEDGALHHDGSGWRAVDAAMGELVAVTRGHDAMLVGGPLGLFELRAIH